MKATTDDEIAELALRRLAWSYRPDAKRQTNPNVRAAFEKRASECERMAERIARSTKGCLAVPLSHRVL